MIASMVPVCATREFEVSDAKQPRHQFELRHVPRWQLALADRPAGVAVRALAWLGREKADEALSRIKRKLPPDAFGELVAAAPQFPTWLARSVGRAAHG